MFAIVRLLPEHIATHSATHGEIMIAKSRFSDRSVKAFKHKKQRDDVIEPGRTGLSIRVAAAPSTLKTWQFLYRVIRDGKSVPRRMPLGKYPATTLKEARRKLADAKRDKEHGKDPARTALNAKAEDHRAKTVNVIFDDYMADRVRGKLASAAAIEGMFRRDILPAIGRMKAKDVRRRDLSAILVKIRGRNAFIMANRTRGECRRFFDYAIELELIEANPTYLLKSTSEVARQRVLSPGEIGAFWNGLPDTDVPTLLQLALKFLALTGQRRSEVLAAPRVEFDREERIWEIPRERIKKDRPHFVPLSDMALDLLDQIKEVAGDVKYLFPSPARPDRPYSPTYLSDVAFRKTKALGLEPWTVHDLRRTAATEMSRLGISQNIIDRVQGRIERGTGARYYNRYDHLSRPRIRQSRQAGRDRRTPV